MDKIFAGNEGVTTDESPTANMKVEQISKSPNKNQTFPTRPLLDQIFVESEGVLTTESPTAKMEVVLTAESPTLQTSCDKRAICRNTRNPSGHMVNEGDEIQFNSLSPLKINIKQTRRVTYSVDPGNE